MYAKLFSREVLMSSLTQYQPVENRGVFFMLIAAADKQGYVLGDDEAIARIINVPMDVFSRALDAMMSPDPKSKSKEYEGRRIIRLDDSPGLLIVNYEKYSGIGSDEQRREYFRVKKAESRAREKAAGKPGKNGSNSGTHAQSITPIYDAYPRKVGRPKALASIERAVKQFGYEHVLEKTKEFALVRAGQDGQYTPNPETFFNQHRFNDDPSTWKDREQASSPSQYTPPNSYNEKIEVPRL